MTVAYLRTLRRHSGTSAQSCQRFRPSSSGGATDAAEDSSRPPSSSCSSEDNCVTGQAGASTTTYDYVAGFSECARQVRRFLMRQQSTSGADCAAAAAPEIAAAAAASGDMPQMLWRHLSEYVTARRHRSTSNDYDRDSRLPHPTTSMPEVMSPDTTTTTPQQSVFAAFPPGFSVSNDSSDTRSRLIGRPPQTPSHPVFSIFTSDPRYAVAMSGLPLLISPTQAMPFHGISAVNAASPTSCHPETEMWPRLKCNVGRHRNDGDDTSPNTGFVSCSMKALASEASSVDHRKMECGSDADDGLKVWRPWGLRSSASAAEWTLDENGNCIRDSWPNRVKSTFDGPFDEHIVVNICTVFQLFQLFLFQLFYLHSVNLHLIGYYWLLLLCFIHVSKIINSKRKIIALN